ncbi:hypothetical protein BGX24_005268, partial [Mortierella sp. AD032]
MSARLDVIVADSETRTVNVPYKDTEPVFFVLERIRSQLGTKTEDLKRQDLYINGKRILDQEKSMGHYRIFGRTLTYRALTDKDITLQIKCLTGVTRTMVCQPTLTGKDLKNLYWQQYDIPFGMARFIYEGKEVWDDSILHEMGIRADCTLHVVLRLRGGGNLPGIVFSDVSDTSNVRKVQFSQNAPRGRFAAPGTNVECNCACTPTHKIICTKSYSTLELSESTFECPNCNRTDAIVPVTVGFMQCKYRFHGIKETGEQYSSDWVEVNQRDCYQLFSSDNTTAWRRLVIESVDLRECDECTICLEKLQSFSTLECGHKFHDGCTNGWTGPCPNCRFNQHLTTGRAAESA